MTNGGNATYFMRNESIFCVKMQINSNGFKKKLGFLSII